MRYFLLPLFIAGAFALSGCLEKADVAVSQAYAFATAPVQKHGAAFLSIENTTDGDVKITAAKSDVAERVELHTHEMNMEGGMMMRQVEAFTVAPHMVHFLEPAGDHIMLMDLKAPLEAGQTFGLTLTTEAHGDIEVSVKVVAPGQVPSGAMH